ncbi:MAG: hypothetical protein ACLFPY_08470 [Desulfonatronovibrio sp.]
MAKSISPELKTPRADSFSGPYALDDMLLEVINFFRQDAGQ